MRSPTRLKLAKVKLSLRAVDAALMLVVWSRLSSIERAVSHRLIAPDQARDALKRVAAGEPNVDHSTIHRLKARYAAEVWGSCLFGREHFRRSPQAPRPHTLV